MRDPTPLRERYMRDSLAVRLGGLAANLSRVRSFAGHDGNSSAAASVLEESKHFIEWTAPEMEPEGAAELVQVQIEIARLQLRWERIWSDRERRHKVAEQSGLWAQHILEMSGLLGAA
jgi:hypothetical protein